MKSIFGRVVLFELDKYSSVREFRKDVAETIVDDMIGLVLYEGKLLVTILDPKRVIGSVAAP